MFHVPEKYRIKAGKLASTEEFGNNGAFMFHTGSRRFQMIASDGDGWEHVSVSLHGDHRTPNWEEMCKVKEMFWDDEDVVVEYHPKKSEYVNNHRYVLHLWRPANTDLPRPPMYMV